MEFQFQVRVYYVIQGKRYIPIPSTNQYIPILNMHHSCKVQPKLIFPNQSKSSSTFDFHQKIEIKQVNTHE